MRFCPPASPIRQPTRARSTSADPRLLRRGRERGRVDCARAGAYRAAVRWILPAAVVLAAATVTAQAPPDVETLLARVGDTIAEYYHHAQNVVCTEKTTV